MINPARYIQTLRYLRPVQIYGLIWFMLYRPKPDMRPAPLLRRRNGVPAGWAMHAPSMLGPERFHFLNEEGVIAEGWNPPGRSKLWVYNLHYFDDLNAQGARQRSEWHRAMIRRWIRENSTGKGPGWEPYPISLRVVNWIKWMLGVAPKGSGESELWGPMTQSLAVQARFLRGRLEHHLLGNHLLANAKALVFAGLFFKGAEAERWLDLGLRILERELPEQVFSDGGHFERSPMYQAIVLESMLDLINLARIYPLQLGVKHISAWREAAGRMLAWLSTMIHPDGEIVLFNDAAFEVAARPAELAAYAERLGVFLQKNSQGSLYHLEDSGYLRISAGPAVVFLDVAPLGPDYLPGHGHADTLTFELSLWDRRVIIDSGTSTYNPGAERARQRGTSAHNTVTVDWQNSSEVWASFRVARRARPMGLRTEQDEGLITVRCSHDGYRRLPGRPLHSRKWCLGPRSMFIEDTVSGSFSEAVARYHFHPEVNANCLSANEGQILLTGGRKLRWKISEGSGRLIESRYYPKFGLSIPNQCLEVRFKGTKETTEFSWV